jgi:hypothetical protein
MRRWPWSGPATSETRSDRRDPRPRYPDDGDIDGGDAGHPRVTLPAAAGGRRGHALVHQWADASASFAQLVAADLASALTELCAILDGGADTHPGTAANPRTGGYLYARVHTGTDSCAHAWTEPQPPANSWSDTLTDDVTITFTHASADAHAVTDALRRKPRQP